MSILQPGHLCSGTTHKIGEDSQLTGSEASFFGEELFDHCGPAGFINLILPHWFPKDLIDSFFLLHSEVWLLIHLERQIHILLANLPLEILLFDSHWLCGLVQVWVDKCSVFESEDDWVRAHPFISCEQLCASFYQWRSLFQIWWVEPNDLDGVWIWEKTLSDFNWALLHLNHTSNFSIRNSQEN